MSDEAETDRIKSLFLAAMGVYGVRIEDPAQIGPELTKALASGKPAVLDVVIDGAL